MTAVPPSGDPAKTPQEIRAWLVAQVAARVGSDPRRINPAERFSRFGLDSMKASAVTAELSVFLGRPLPRTLLWDHPSIDNVVRHLTSAPASAPAPAAAPVAARKDEPIAIVGLACRFPNAPDAAAYWRLLIDGVDAIREVPAERWDLERYFSADTSVPGRMSTRWGGFLDGVDQFDPQFFGISPREAEQMDPQQRIVLELACEALEDAGVRAPELKDTLTGVYIGAMWSDYARLLAGTPEGISQHTPTGQDTSIIAARISYTFGLQGPSLAINTACSSSLVAVHTACQALRSGDATMALAGGVNLVLSPESTVAMSKFGGMAPDGRSKAFDARANGYVRGEGAGVVVLKPLSQAVRDGDAIYCVILGEGINNDGFSNGLTAPNPQAQEEMLRLAYARAGISPADVDYIETHGTGTLLGDPIEAGAIGRVLGAARGADRPLALGSVKTNIGHLEAAAGMAGLIKVALAIRHRRIPGNLHFESPNPNIDFEALHLRVQSAATPWPAAGRPSTAGVSGFGFGGTNCHIVLQDRPRSEAECLPLSGPDKDGLRRVAAKLLRHLRALPDDTPLAPLCRAAADQLAGGPQRAALTARSVPELRSQLEALLERGSGPGIATGSAPAARPPLVWILSAHGGQWAGMGRQLLEHEPAFRRALQQCSGAIAREAGWDLIEELLADEAHSRLGTMDIAQPAIFSIQVALAALWRSWGIEPDAVIGHSMGEVAAAHIAGALTLDAAVKVICTRSRLLARTSGKGALALVGLSAPATRAALEGRGDRLWVVAFNSPQSTLVSGDPEELAALLADLERDGVFCRKVRVDVAPHSPHTDPLLEELAASVAGITPVSCPVAIYSTVEGARLDGSSFGAAYWVRNLRQPVLFAQAVDAVLDAGPATFLELGPHPVLAPALAQSLAQEGRSGRVLESLRRAEDDRGTLLDALGQLYVEGRPARFDRILPAWAAETLPPDIVSLANAAPPDAAAAIPFVLSSHTPSALVARARGMAEWLRTTPASLHDVCYTAAVRRVPQPHRIATPARTTTELADLLEAFTAGDLPPGLSTGERDVAGPGRIVFVFPGQGSQWIGMGRQLLRTEPRFAEALERCDAAIRRVAGWSVLDAIGGAPGAGPDTIDVIQPSLFAMQVSLASLWRAWGIEPSAVVGHSMGEVAASHVAGALSLDDAAVVICRRSRLLRRISGQGLMGLVELSMDDAAHAIRGFEDRLSVAVSNSARSTVLSGDPAALVQVMERLAADGVFCKQVKVDVASHSPQVDPLHGDLLAALDGVRPSAASVPVYSTVTASPTDGREFDAGYWARNLREPVMFSAAVSRLVDDGFDTFVEVSPHPLLLPAIQESFRDRRRAGIAVPSLRRDEDERAVMLSSLGALFSYGHDVDFNPLFPEGGRIVSLPPQAWDRQRCWLDLPDRSTDAAAARGVDECFYEIRWAAQPLTAATATPQKRWLILGDMQGLGRALADRLSAAGQQVVLARIDEPSAGTREENIARLVEQHLGPGAPACDAIVDLSSADAIQATPDAGSIESEVDAGAFGGLRLVQLLASVERRPRLYFVTCGAQPAGGTAVTSPGQAALWGLASAVAVESPEFACTRIDLERQGEVQAAALAGELLAGSPDDLVALRAASRHVARLEPGVSAIDTAAALASLAELVSSRGDAALPPIRRAMPNLPIASLLQAPALPDLSRGTCLVTGGLRGLGLTTAEWLVEHGARHLVLVARSAPAPDVAATLDRLRGLGAEIRTFQADVAVEADMAKVLEAVDRELPPLRVVVHSAGTLDDAVISSMDRGKLRAVLAPKVRGACVLHRLTRDRELDLFVLYSSVLGFLGAAGQANHAIANAFLDGLAHYRRGRGLPATSINWGVWAEVGSAAVAGRGDRLSAMGLASITPGEGREALERILVADAVQAAVMRFDAGPWRRQFAGADKSTLFSRLAVRGGAEPQASGDPAEAGLAERLAAAAPGPERQAVMETYLAKSVARVLRLRAADVDCDKPLRAMGLDSLMAVEFRNRLEAGTGASIPTTLIWNYPTITKLAPEIASRMGIPLEEAPAAHTEAGGDLPEDLEAILREIETLSNDDARRALEKSGPRVADV